MECTHAVAQHFTIEALSHREICVSFLPFNEQKFCISKMFVCIFTIISESIISGVASCINL